MTKPNIILFNKTIVGIESYIQLKLHRDSLRGKSHESIRTKISRA